MHENCKYINISYLDINNKLCGNWLPHLLRSWPFGLQFILVKAFFKHPAKARHTFHSVQQRWVLCRVLIALQNSTAARSSALLQGFNDLSWWYTNHCLAEEKYTNRMSIWQHLPPRWFQSKNKNSIFSRHEQIEKKLFFFHSLGHSRLRYSTDCHPQATSGWSDWES